MEIIFLGTSAGKPTKERNVTSIALRLESRHGRIWLFDCGEGTQRQLFKMGINPNKIEKIFITHLHGDHVFGLIPLMAILSGMNYANELAIYGPKGLAELIEVNCRLTKTHLTYRYHVYEMSDDEQSHKGLQSLWEDDQYHIWVGALTHDVPSYGFRIEEADQRGALDAKRLMAMGISPGPIYQRLARGEKVTLEDGRVIFGSDYIGEIKRGRIVAIFGDTTPTANALLLAYKADLLIHEATVCHDRESWAHEYGHSTSVDAAQLAKESEANALILTHTSSRYDEKGRMQLLAEAQELFSNTRLADDYACYRLNREGTLIDSI